VVNDATEGGSRHEVFWVKSYWRQVSDCKDRRVKKNVHGNYTRMIWNDKDK